MLSGAVDSVKRLLVEDHLEMMFLSDFLHHDHQHHVLVYRLCRIAIHRSAFELVRRHLVMSCLKKDTKLICLCLKVFHERNDTRRYGAEVMILKLLVLSRGMSYDSPSREHEVRACIVKRLVYKEIFLLNSKVHPD